MANKEANTKKENNKNKKSFFKDFKAELKKVNWPTPKQLLNNTIAVVTIVIITAVIVFALDVVFEILNKQGVDKIKEVIVTDNSVLNETTNNTTQENASTQNETTAESNTTQENTEASNTENNATQNNVAQ
ncbi:MAG: preprotein translocase subunit SecE [Clostridia bacterium]|nr:preprotein translocase subunit SecE [Clostridia bacterium]